MQCSFWCQQSIAHSSLFAYTATEELHHDRVELAAFNRFPFARRLIALQGKRPSCETYHWNGWEDNNHKEPATNEWVYFSSYGQGPLHIDDSRNGITNRLHSWVLPPIDSMSIWNRNATGRPTIWIWLMLRRCFWQRVIDICCRRALFNS